MIAAIVILRINQMTIEIVVVSLTSGLEVDLGRFIPLFVLGTGGVLIHNPTRKLERYHCMHTPGTRIL